MLNLVSVCVVGRAHLRREISQDPGIGRLCSFLERTEIVLFRIQQIELSHKKSFTSYSYYLVVVYLSTCTILNENVNHVDIFCAPQRFGMACQVL